MFSSVTLTPEEIEICERSDTFIEHAKFLKSLTSRSVHLLEFETVYGNTNLAKRICSYITARKGKQTVLDNYDKFQMQGKLFFLGDTKLLNEKRTIERGFTSVSGDRCIMLGLLSNTTDPVELIKLTGTSWANCSITTDKLIRKVLEWHEKFGLKIYQVTFDKLAAQIIDTDLDYNALAREIHELCPEGTETTIEENAKQMKMSGEIFLWWD